MDTSAIKDLARRDLIDALDTVSRVLARRIFRP